MNFLKKGPELKPSDIKLPGFVEDVYYDLKDRHLLPVAAVLLVAIVAVPIAIGKSGSGEEAPAPGAGATASQSPASSQGGQLVAEAAPGLRDYRRRLDHLHAKDPFKQQYTGAPAGSGSSGGAQSEPGGASTVSPALEGSNSSGTPSSEESTGGETTTKHELTYYSYAIDVRVSGGGETGSKEATVRRNLPELTMLPSRETPAIVFMGATKDGKKAVMTVSSDVQAIFGDAKCVLGSERCELLVMEPGLPETFVYGGAGRTYKIELLKIDLVESKELNRAPLGKPKKKQQKSG